MTDPFSELHRRFDGLIPESERKRAEGIDPVLSAATGAVRFWKAHYATMKEAYQVNTNPSLKRKAELQENLDYARDGLARAKARLAVLEDPATASAKAFFTEMGKSL